MRKMNRWEYDQLTPGERYKKDEREGRIEKSIVKIRMSTVKEGNNNEKQR